MHKGTRHYLGTFDTAEQALEARNKRARELSITGATLPNKTPGPHRSKRGTAQPLPLLSGNMPHASVLTSVPLERANGNKKSVFAAAAQRSKRHAYGDPVQSEGLGHDPICPVLLAETRTTEATETPSASHGACEFKVRSTQRIAFAEAMRIDNCEGDSPACQITGACHLRDNAAACAHGLSKRVAGLTQGPQTSNSVMNYAKTQRQKSRAVMAAHVSGPDVTRAMTLTAVRSSLAHASDLSNEIHGPDFSADDRVSKVHRNTCMCLLNYSFRLCSSILAA